MATNRTDIGTKFQNGDIPSQSDFAEIFDSFVHKDEDKADLQMVETGTDDQHYVTPALLRTGLQNLGIITGNCYMPHKEYFESSFSDTSLSLEKIPIPNSVKVYKNGQLLQENEDYTVNYDTAVITFSDLVSDRNIEIDYWFKNLGPIPGDTDITNIGSSPLEKTDEGNGEGIIIRGRNAANYGNIGLNAVDLSYSGNTSSDFGATGELSFTVGEDVTASGYASSATGIETQATEVASHAEGSGTLASAFASHAEGSDTEANGTSSHAEGFVTTADGISSHAEGERTYAAGDYSHAEGYNSDAIGKYSHAGGQENTANSYAETSIGYFGTQNFTDSSTSIVATDRLFNIGNGASDVSRSNALTVLKNGLATLPSVTNALITAASGKAIVTKEYLETNAFNIPYLEYSLTDKTIWNNGQGNNVYSTSYGDKALSSNVGGYENTAIGYRALTSTTNGYYNTALGTWSLEDNTTGYENTALGYYTLPNNTTGFANTAVGYSSMRQATTGQYNQAFGYYSLRALTAGISNTALGYAALGTLTTGDYNVAVGENAGYSQTSGFLTNPINSIYIGTHSKALADNPEEEMVIGYNTTGHGTKTATWGSVRITDHYFNGNIRGNAFVKTGGTSAQYLMADGSVTTATPQGDFLATTTPTPTAGMAKIYAKTTTGTDMYVMGSDGVEIKIGGSAPDLSTYAKLASPTLTGVPIAPTASAGTNTTQIATTAFVQANARPYKSYVAILNQNGTSAPTATVLENTLGGDIIWTYNSIGNYTGTATGLLTLNKTVALQGESRILGNVGFAKISLSGSTSDVILVTSFNVETVPFSNADNVISKMSIEIRVYP